MRSAAGLVAGVVLLSACSGAGSDSTLAAPTSVPLPPIDTTSTTEPPPAVEACGDVPFVPSVLPEGVTEAGPDVSAIPFDIYTTISGTTTSVWSSLEGQTLLVMIRGALPPVRWLETPEVIAVRDTDAALGPLPDGFWGVAWFEGPDRCDEYSIILYPPADADLVRAIAESVVAGERLP